MSHANYQQSEQTINLFETISEAIERKGLERNLCKITLIDKVQI